MLSHLAWKTKNIQGILFRVKKTLSLTSAMILSSKSMIMNPKCPLGNPLLDPPISDTFPIKISTWNFQGILLSLKKHQWHNITLSFKFSVRNPQRHPSPSLLDNLPVKITTWTFQDIFWNIPNYRVIYTLRKVGANYSKRHL